MEITSEVTSITNNIKYYSQQLEKLVRQQIERDFEDANIVGMNTGPGTIRFDNLGAIGSAASWIRTYCEGIEANLKHAESQDKKLKPVRGEDE